MFVVGRDESPRARICKSDDDQSDVTTGWHDSDKISYQAEISVYQNVNPLQLHLLRDVLTIIPGRTFRINCD